MTSGLLSALRPLASRFLPAAAAARLTILIYHRVLPSPDPGRPGDIHAALFRRQMQLLAGCCTVMPLPEAVARLRTGTLPARAAALTFDDGYADNLVVALPILQTLGLQATFFIASDYLDGGRMWNDTVIEAVNRSARPEWDLEDLGLGRHALGGPEGHKAVCDQLVRAIKYLPAAERDRLAGEILRRADIDPAALPRELMLTSVQVRALHAAGMTIGAHTASHPILARTTPEEARLDIERNRGRLEALIDAPVRLFAYPNGKPGQDYAPEHVALVRSLGFDAAVSTATGVATRQSDPWQLPRFSPRRHGAAQLFYRLLRNSRRPR